MARRRAAIKTGPPSRRDERRARRTGVRAADHAHGVPQSPYPALHRAQSDEIVAARTVSFDRLTADATELGREHAATLSRRNEALADQRELLPARIAAGSLLQALLPIVAGYTVLSFLGMIDVAGALTFMERLTMPLLLPPNITRSMGALTIGLVIVLFARWAASIHHQHAEAEVSGTTPERRAAAARARRTRVRIVFLLVVAVGLVGAIAYARATTPDTSGELIRRLPWEAMAAIGLLSIAAAFLIELRLADRLPALHAHRRHAWAGWQAGRYTKRLTRGERSIHSVDRSWTGAVEGERRDLRGLAARLLMLDANWLAGAATLSADVQPRGQTGFELQPPPTEVELTPDAQAVLRGIERAAAEQLWLIDPFAVVLPRRNRPPVLRTIRAAAGTAEVARV